MDKYAAAFALIAQWIITNGNNEITAAVLNPVLNSMLQAAKDVTGNLEDLDTTDQTNLVAAINELKAILDTVNTLTGIVLHQGNADPNVTPPPSFNPADFYLQKDVDNIAEAFWQYNPVSSIWVKVQYGGAASFSPSAQDFTYSGSNIFSLPSGKKAITVSIEGITQKKANWTQLDDDVTVTNEYFGGEVVTISYI